MGQFVISIQSAARWWRIYETTVIGDQWRLETVFFFYRQLPATRLCIRNRRAEESRRRRGHCATSLWDAIAAEGAASSSAAAINPSTGDSSALRSTAAAAAVTVETEGGASSRAVCWSCWITQPTAALTRCSHMVGHITTVAQKRHPYPLSGHCVSQCTPPPPPPPTTTTTNAKKESVGSGEGGAREDGGLLLLVRVLIFNGCVGGCRIWMTEVVGRLLMSAREPGTHDKVLQPIVNLSTFSCRSTKLHTKQQKQ